MGKRILSGAALAVLALVTILSGGLLLLITLFVVSCTAYRELVRAFGVCRGKGLNSLEAVGYAGIACFYGLLWCQAGSGQRLPLIVILLLVAVLMAFMSVYVFKFPRYHAEQVTAAFFAFTYAPVMLSFVYLTRNLPYGIYTVWMIFISSWICDTCAYFAGVTLGRHKLAPVLSPKKSVEGALGGILGSAVAGALYAVLLVENVIPEQTVTWVFALIGAAGAVLSQIGDLAASAIKRNHGIKDYGTCIPGHGGIMDRFDSVIFTAPVIYCMAALLIGA